MNNDEIVKCHPISLKGDVEFEIYKGYRKINTKKNHAVLIVKFIGIHGHGSGGNYNSNFMQTVVAASIGLNYQDGFIFDLTDLTYEFGDSLSAVLSLPQKIMGNSFPTSIVVSDTNEKSIKSLLKFDGLSLNLYTTLETAVSETFNDLQSVQPL